VAQVEANYAQLVGGRKAEEAAEGNLTMSKQSKKRSILAMTAPYTPVLFPFPNQYLCPSFNTPSPYTSSCRGFPFWFGWSGLVAA
jgi:hypothetical protein